MKRILVTGASNIGKAGVATLTYKLGQNLDSETIIYDYLSQRGLPDKIYVDKIELIGGKIHVPSNISQNKIRKYIDIMRWTYDVIKDNNYEIVHINTDTAYLAAIYMYIARKAGVKKIIVHSHSIMVDDKNFIRRSIKKLLHFSTRKYINKHANIRFACSILAAKWLFGKNKEFTVIPNGIELEEYKYNENIRKEYRNKMDMENKFILGSVGRLSYSKNCFKTIQIFQEVLKKIPNSVLLLIGDGEQRDSINSYIKQNKLENKCILLGNRNDVKELLSMLDIFVLPSRFEGLGIVYIEAQAAGLQSFASDKVPEEAFVTKLMHRIDIDASSIEWAEEIIKYKEYDRNDSYFDELKKAKYDIKMAANLLQEVCKKEIL